MANKPRILNAVLDWIARSYLWMYHELLQRPEPFTRQADRINRRWPLLTVGTLIVTISLTAQLREWFLVITLVVDLFALWFVIHIDQYERAHVDNVPFKQWYENRRNGLLAWAKKRVKK